MESIKTKPIDFSQDLVDIEVQVEAAIIQRILVDGPAVVIRALVPTVLAHAFVDEELERELLRAMASAAGVDVVNYPDDKD